MKVQVCVGSNCMLLGAMNILDQIEDLKDIINDDPDNYSDEEIVVEPVSCLLYCKNTNESIAPVVVIDGEEMFNATSQNVMEKIVTKLRK